MLKYLLLIGLVMFSQIRGQQIFHTETYKDRSIKNITYHKKIQQDGVSRIVPVKLEEYYKDGQLYKIENYSKRIPYGRLENSTKWYKNGQKEYEITYKDGKEDGLHIWWYKNGQKKKEGNYKNDVKDGLWTTWYENGQKMRQEKFINGKNDGLSTSWYQNGRKKSEEKYVDGSTDCSFESFDEEELVVNKVITKIVKGVKNYSMERYLESGMKSYPNNPFETLYELPECYIETNESRKDGYWWFSNDTIHYGLKYKWIYDSDSGTLTKL